MAAWGQTIARRVPFPNPRHAILRLTIVGTGVTVGVWPPMLGADDEPRWHSVFPEERTLRPTLPPRYQTNVPQSSEPATILKYEDREEWRLSLDEAIHVALQNAEAIRVANGTTIRGSGQTIYDVAIANAKIDAERARFDPEVTLDNTFGDRDVPTAGIVVPNPRQFAINGFNLSTYNMEAGIQKQNSLGGVARLDVETNVQRQKPRITTLNPLTSTRAGVSYVQPLLQGAGRDVNLAPIRIAQLDTDRTYFQTRGSIQDLTYSVIQAYWRLESARVSVWAREQQVEQGKFAYERAQARMRQGLADSAEVAQTRLAYANFRSASVVAKSNQLDAENSLRNLLFLSPVSDTEILPVTSLHAEPLDFNWEELLELADRNRNDLQELRTVVQSDQQKITLAKTKTLPQLNLVAGYGWTNTQGERQGLFDSTITGYNASGSRFPDWMLGVNFDMPLGFREGRANVRGQELNYSRDLANLRQTQHAAIHDVAGALRSIVRSYAEFESYRETRIAAAENLDQQRTEYENGRTTFLDVLQAIVNWGDAVNAEVDSLARFNVELANLERQTGTILETHAVHFMQEKFCADGPLGHRRPVEYPMNVRPTGNQTRYGAEAEPPERKYFDQNRTKTTGGSRATGDATTDSDSSSRTGKTVAAPIVPTSSR